MAGKATETRTYAAAGARWSRRRVLLLVGAGAGAAILAACGDTAAPTDTPVPTAAARPTGASSPPSSTSGATTPAASPATTPPAASTTAPASIAVATTAPTAAATAATASPVATVATMGVAPTPDANGKVPGGLPGVPDAYTKFPPPYKAFMGVAGKGGKVTTFQYYFAMPTVGRDQNVYWREVEKRLNVTIDATFAPPTNYAEKLAAITASSDFPDLTFLNVGGAPDIVRALQQGAFTDLTSERSGDGLKQYPNLATHPPQVWKNLAFRDKIYGAPRLRLLGGPTTLVYRRDWAMKVAGFAQPKNAEEFFAMAVAFTKNDPDGNGKADTFGLCGVVGTDFFSLGPLSQYFRVPNNWRQNADGTLTNAIETEEYRQMLAFAKRLFDAGVYHPDGLTLSQAQTKDFVVSGKIGAYTDSVGGLPGTGGVRARAKALNPAADITSMIPFGADGGKGFAYNGPGYLGYAAIPAKVGRDKERVKELLRILDYHCAPFGSEEWIFLNFGLEGVHHTVQPNGDRLLTDQGKREIGDLNNFSNDAAKSIYYDNPGDAQLLQNLVREMQPIGVDDPTQSLYSATAVMKGAELRQLGLDRTTAIVTGREPFTALDTYVKDWRSRGGDMIRKEYQDALKG